MTRNAVIVLVGVVLYMCSPRGIEANPIPNISVLSEMKYDKEICASGIPFRDSNFTKICDKVKYPSSNATLNPNDSEQLLCLGLYDRIIRLCHLDTLRMAGKSVLPDDVSQFDAEVKKSLPSEVPDIVTFCGKWNNDYPPKYEKTKPYVAQLEKMLKNLILCLKLCTNEQGILIPLCSVLAKMDEMSKLISVSLDNVKGKQEGKLDSQMQVAQPQSQQQDAAAQNAKSQTTIGSADPQKPTENQKAKNLPAKSSDILAKELPEGSKTEPNLDKPQQEKNQETSHPSPTTKSKKLDVETRQPERNILNKANVTVSAANLPDTNAGNDDQKENVKPEKEEQAEKPVVEKTSQDKNNDMGKNEKASDLPAPPIDEAAGPQNQATSGEDISDVGGLIDDPKLGVISQHTQDEPEDQLADADPVEAIEPLSPDDDVDPNLLQPSEKREFIPRMPSIPNEDDSHLFGYFTVIGVMCIAGYVGYHNKQKILAMVLEGRRSRGGRSRRRPSTANYRKLDCTLEEAVTSQCNSNVTHVIY